MRSSVTLLQSVTAALNGIYGGNIMAHNAEIEDENAVRHVDLYHCSTCGSNVKEEDFDHAGK